MANIPKTDKPAERTPSSNSAPTKQDAETPKDGAPHVSVTPKPHGAEPADVVEDMSGEPFVADEP